jgi:hypothetical protein
MKTNAQMGLIANVRSASVRRLGSGSPECSALRRLAQWAPTDCGCRRGGPIGLLKAVA